MDVPGKVPETINCHACGAVIDLTGKIGFTHVDCPRCDAVSVVPVKFGNFLLLNMLGVGGMGTVYKAIDLHLNRYLALKILRPKLAASGEFIERFTREARSAAAVNHSNVAQVYAFGELDGQYYLSMELLERGSLDDRISRERKLSEREVLEIGAAIASGLRAAQQRGLLHRDIKPGNILFTQEGVPKIVDFGLARGHAETADAGDQQIWGTPYYIAPEKLRGQPDDFRSDMYSLGATLFHALAGRPPFEAETADEVVSKQAHQPAFSLKTYAPGTQDYTAHVIARMLAKEPAERYGSYDELVHDLHEAKSILRVAESTPALVAPTGESVSINSIAGTVAAVLVCIVVVWGVWKKRHDWFGFEKPAAPVVAAATTTAVRANVSDELDFPDDEPWMKAWNTAALQLAQGRFNEALLGYDNAMQLLGPDRPAHRRWIQFFEGLTLLAADRPSEAERCFFRAVDPHGKPGIPDQVTTGNFASVLATTMMRGTPAAELEAALPRLPAWAAAVARLTIAFHRLDAGEFTPAAEAFRQYAKLPRDNEQRWAFNLQPLAPKLAARCDEAATALAGIDALAKGQKFASALDAVRAAKTNATLFAFKSALVSREAELEKELAAERERMEALAAEAERKRLEQEVREREQATAEKQQLQTFEAGIANLWSVYDFKTAQIRYDALTPNFATSEGKRALQARQTMVRLLVEFKAQLVADFIRRPYNAEDLQTRTGARLVGRLGRATDKQLVFTSQYGEVLTDWSDLAPPMLIKLAVFYANASTQTEKADVRARRYLLLAVFCRQYGLDRSATGYLRQAELLQPTLPAEAELVFGGGPN